MVWLPIKGFSRYCVNEEGDIWSTFKDRLRKTYVSPCGWRRVSLIDDNKKSRGLLVASLVARAHVPKGDLALLKNLVVHAKDGDNANCRASNLCWQTRSLSQHLANRTPKGPCGYVGVRKEQGSANARGQVNTYFTSRVTVKNRTKYLRCSKDPHTAAKAYNAVTAMLFGDEARLNVVPA